MTSEGFQLDAWHMLLVGLYGLAAYNCYCVVRDIRDRANPGSAIAWILINITLPVVGVPLYFLLGDFRIRGYVRRYRAAAAEIEDETPQPEPHVPIDPDSLPLPLQSSVRALAPFAKFGPEFEPYYGSVDLLIDGTSTFAAIFRAIANAKTYILVQYYILRSDRLGLELKRLLVEKAKAGIPVYLLYDDMGSFWLSRDYIRDLRKAGVEVARFLPLANFKRFFQLNFRNHRKLVVVDGAEAFTGGLNVGEEYAARKAKTRRDKAKQLRYWRDTHVRITGPAVELLEEIFLEDWYFATGEPMRMSRLPSPPPSPPEDATIVQLVPTGPTDEAVISILFLMHVINTAQRRLWIATPYFVPDAPIVRALELAALRGVDVRVILPHTSDNKLVHWVSLSFGEQLQSKGILVLLYEAGMMHQKVILADDVAVLGTMNIDNRALYLNFETMVAVHGRSATQRVEEMLQRDFLSCRFHAPPKNRIMKRLVRARASCARLLAPML